MAMSLVMRGRPGPGEKGCVFRVRLGDGRSRACNRRVHRDGKCLRHDPQRMEESLASHRAQRADEKATPRHEEH